MFEFFDVYLDGNTLVFSNGETKVATEEEKGYFKRRKRLKATKICVDKENQIYEWKIIRWADLHRHTGYSLLDGCISVKDMVKHTEFAGAVTDHGNMFCSLTYYNEMKKANKMPIIGQEFYCETIDGNKRLHHIILLAKNYEGYQNLAKLSSMAFHNIYYKPHISYEMLKEHANGLICTSACIGGELPKLLLAESEDPIIAYKKAENVVEWFKNVFGDDYYIEIQRHGLRNEEQVNGRLIQIAHKYGVKVICTTDAHYVKKDDAEAHEILLCIGTQKTLADESRLRFEGTGYHLYTADEIEELFSDIPEGLRALDNTLEIMEKCGAFEIKTGEYIMPPFPIPAAFKDEYSYLKKLSKDGFKERFEKSFTVQENDSPDIVGYKNKKKKEYWSRLKYELSVIEQMGFAGYFLIVWDFIKFARDNDIPIGPGRGSGAGSLVMYCLHITDIDPIKYGLLFERFLNPDRISMPDVDSDISDRKRELVINYVTQKYGAECVSRIITFGTLAAKSAVRDVAKVLGFTPSEAAKLTKAIPEEPKMTIEKALKSAGFKAIIDSNPDYQKIIEIAQKIEGLPRNTGTHACGVIIAPSAVSNYIPQAVVVDDNGVATVSTQYTMENCENMGLLKMDFLGLRTLDVIDSTLMQINNRNGTQMTKDDIPVNDPKVYKFLQTGHTSGVFQFESPGMTTLLKSMFADVRVRDAVEKGNEYFERLIAAVSLYRPGPMDEIPNYLKAMKSGVIHYDTPELESILNNTYGIFVYQEQIMFAVRKLAGFTAGQSDAVRKAMGKKKEALMKEYGEYFLHGSAEWDKANPENPLKIKGCVKNGIPEATAKLIWDKMAKFAEYAFNKSHATAYATIGVKTAWLSCYYPVEFMAGTLNSFIGDTDKIRQYVNSCKERGIRLYAPSINESAREFLVVDDVVDNGKRKKYIKAIRFGLGGIKGVGDVAANAIIEERSENGKFESLEDFLTRMAIRGKMGKSTLEALILTGALDEFPGTRAGKMQALPQMQGVVTENRKADENQINLFDILGVERYHVQVPDIPEYPQVEQALLEESYLGFFVNHPINCYSQLIAKRKAKNMLSDIAEFVQVKNETTKNDDDNLMGDAVEAAPIFTERKSVRFLGLVRGKEVKMYYKNNRPQKLIKFVLDDGTGRIKCVCFGKESAKFGEKIEDNSFVYLLGTLSNDDFGLQCIVQNIEVLTEDKQDKPQPNTADKTA